MNNKRELVELVHVGIERKKAVEHFAKQVNIPLPREPVAVEGHFDIQAPQQKALLITLKTVMFHVLNRLQTPGVQFIFLPVIERQGATQDFGSTHHVQEPGAQVAQNPPVEAIFSRRVNR